MVWWLAAAHESETGEAIQPYATGGSLLNYLAEEEQEAVLLKVSTIDESTNAFLFSGTVSGGLNKIQVKRIRRAGVKDRPYR
jgi:hypothetical protein